MRQPLDNVVINEGNREAFEAVIGITAEGKEPENLYLYGPSEAGKTLVMSARGSQKDLLSSRTVMFSNAAELLAAFELDMGEDLLDSVGSVDVLLLDAFDAFFEVAEYGPLLCKLLLIERKNQGLTTVMAGRKPLSEYDLSLFEGVLDDYRQLEVRPLDAQGYADLALNVQERFRSEREDGPVLSDEAIAFIAGEFATSVRDVNNAVQYLITAADFEGGGVISAAQAKEALGC